MTTRVRRATTADIPVIVDFNHRLAGETERKELDGTTLERGVTLALQRADMSRYYVAEQAGRVIGQAMVTYEWSDWRAGVLWWLQSVYVEPTYRRNGVLRALFERIAAEARDQPDVCGVRLYVANDNHHAMQAYRALGMRPSGYQIYEVDWAETA